MDIPVYNPVAKTARPKPSDEVALDALDPGIRNVVSFLRSRGFETTDSGDGVSKPADERVFEVPHVAIPSTPSAMVLEADYLDALMLEEFGEGWHVEASYSTEGRSAILLVLKVKA